MNKLIEKIIIETVTNGGYTVNINTGVDKFSGYAVAVDNTERTVSLYKGTLQRLALLDFINDHEELLSKPDRVLGTWGKRW